MKYSTNLTNDSALFYEQYQHISHLYENWNNCQRTVVVHALFKNLPVENLKFLLSSIEHHMKSSNLSQHSFVEEAANSISFLKKLPHKYNSFVNFASSTDTVDTCHSDQEQISSSSDNAKGLESDLMTRYTCKDDIVNDLLMYLLLLRPNNDEGKKVYIQLVPMLCEDAFKQNISVETVQQLLSYLLVHPVLKNEDKKIVQPWVMKLQDFLASGYQSSSSSGVSGMNYLSSDNTSSYMSNASSISSASSSSSASSTTWPTAVPQIQTNTCDLLGNTKKLSDQEFWDLNHFQVSADFFEGSKNKYQPSPIGQGQQQQQQCSFNNQSGTDEHHISFSKNGTEVDFESEFFETSNVTSGSKAVHAPFASTSSQDFLTVPNFSPFENILYGYGGELSTGTGSDAGFSDDGNAIKTRRSNSLTTPNTGISNGKDFTLSSSAENLANLQKPRSYSLSIESSRKTIGSLDDWNKISQMRFNQCHPGMGNIAVWLKSLRLHKYLWLFTNVSYEKMMEMTEEQLENLGVTKGARHKLVLCIQKLADRISFLKQLNKELNEGTRPLKSALDELTNIIMTPMKDINSVPLEEDVAAHVMLLLDIAFKVMQSIKFFTNQDEECVNVFLWILDKTIHHDAFSSQTGHLKDYRYKLQRIKNMFGNKSYGSNGSNSSIGKGSNSSIKRWNNKPKGSVQGNSSQNVNNMSDNQKLRKNSAQFSFNTPSYGNNSNTNANKNLQYQNFSKNGTQQAPMLSNLQRSSSRENMNQFTLMQQQHHMQYTQMPPPASYGHRNSLNSLMPFPPQTQFANRRNSSCGTDRMVQQHAEKAEKSFLSDSKSESSSGTNSDINSRLESLCRQMTEQAIN